VAWPVEPAIAENHVMSEYTVERHISNILSKQGFLPRTQIVIWAVEQGLTYPS